MVIIRNLGLTALAVVLAAPAFAADVPSAPAAPQGDAVQAADTWTMIYNTDVRYFTFSGNRGFPAPNNAEQPKFGRGRGSQFYVPTAYQLTGNPTPDSKFEMTVRGGYVNSRQTSPGFQGSFSGQTDSVVNSTLTLLGFQGFQPFVSMSLNVPTGEAALFGRAANARLDPDLVDLATFGQGWNVGPSAGVNIPVNERMTLSFGGGYTNVGAFRREGAIDPFTGVQGTVLSDAGDSVSVNSSLQYQEGPLSAAGSVVYTWSGTSRNDHIPFFRTGDSVGANVNVGYAWTDYWSTTLSGTFNHTENSFVRDPLFGTLLREQFNSNSNIYRAGLDTAYRVNDQWSLGPVASVMYRDRNAFLPTTAQFVSAKVRTAAGGFVSYAMTDAISFTGRVEHIWTREAPHPDQINFVDAFPILNPGSGTLTLRNEGWAFAAGANVRF